MWIVDCFHSLDGTKRHKTSCTLTSNPPVPHDHKLTPQVILLQLLEQFCWAPTRTLYCHVHMVTEGEECSETVYFYIMGSLFLLDGHKDSPTDDYSSPGR